jgi:hypothetical protein
MKNEKILIMKQKKMWMLPAIGKSNVKPSDRNKSEIENRCQPLIECFKQQYIKKNPDKQFNYLIDVFIKWRGNYLHFCGKYKSEQQGMIKREFEESFVRLEYVGIDNFNFSYFRHTGKWFPVANNLILNDCLELMESNPNFHPID